ncbi:hypothetical protein F5X99DRAFT_413428 [Biscogniauxia marginata]|nr:hypothetical protein F5X99DRAFT_413428 [Biscogniauxia marginata]
MANLPSQHPSLSLHLSDRTLTPLISSSRTPSQLQSLTLLSHTALSAHESAQRLGLGAPQRIMVEHGSGDHPHQPQGPVLLHMFLSSSSAAVGDGGARGGVGSRGSDASGRAPTTASTNTSTSKSQGRAGIGVGGAAQQLSSPSLSNPPRSPHHHQGALALAASSRGGPQDPDGDGPGASYAGDSSAASTITEGPSTGAGVGAAAAARLRGGTGDPEQDDDEDADAPPMLLGIVVAPTADEAREARRAAAKLERVGREIQARWAEAQGRGRGRGRTDDGEEDGAGE